MNQHSKWINKASLPSRFNPARINTSNEMIILEKDNHDKWMVKLNTKIRRYQIAGKWTVQIFANWFEMPFGGRRLVCCSSAFFQEERKRNITTRRTRTRTSRRRRRRRRRRRGRRRSRRETAAAALIIGWNRERTLIGAAGQHAAGEGPWRHRPPAGINTTHVRRISRV